MRIDGGRMICAPTGFRWTVGAAISHPKAFSLLGRRCRAYARRMRVGAGMAKALQRAGQCPAPTKGQETYAYAVGAAHWAARRTPPHSLSSATTKALSKRGVPSFRSLPVSGSERRGKVNRLSHPRLCNKRSARLVGAPVKRGSRGRLPLSRGDGRRPEGIGTGEYERGALI